MKDLEGIPDRTRGPAATEKEPLPPGVAEALASAVVASLALREQEARDKIGPSKGHQDQLEGLYQLGMAHAFAQSADLIAKSFQVARTHSSPLLTAEEGPGCKPPTSS